MTRLLCVFLSLALVPSAVLAGDEAIDYTDFDLTELISMDVVYGASTYEQKVSEAPSAVTVVTADEIKAYGYRTLADVLNSVAGYYVTGDRSYSYLGVRGFSRPGDYDTRMLVLVDGHPVNDNIYGSAANGTSFPLELDLVRRVEVIRGPSSSLYGSSAFFGVINIVTVQAADLDGGVVTAGIGSHQDYSAMLAYGHENTSGFDLVAAGSFRDSDGEDIYFPEFDDPGTNDGVSVDGDYTRNVRLLGTAQYGDLRLQALYGRRNKGIPTGAWETVFNDSRARDVDTYAYADLLWSRPTGDRSDLTVRGTYDYYGYEGWYPYDYAADGEDPWVVMNRDSADGHRAGVNARWTGALGSRHRLVVGGEARRNIKREQVNFDEAPDAWTYLDRDDPSTELAAYLQDEVMIRERVRLSLGLRYDRYDAFESTNPRLGLMATVGGGATFKGLFGTAFRAPNAYELYYGDNELWQKGNADLMPEEMTSWELIWEQRIGERWSGNVSLFYYDVENLISQVEDPDDGMLVFRNLDHVRSKGLEVGLDARLLPGVNGRVSYGYQETRNHQTDALLTDSPQHLGKLNLLVPVGHAGTSVALEMIYVSDRLTLAGDTAEQHLLTNLTLRQPDLLHRFDAAFTVFNLLDSEYGDPGSEEHIQDLIPQPGISARLKLTYHW